jgi:hypothetical protein
MKYVYYIGLFIGILSIVGVGCRQEPVSTPDIDAAVEAPVKATLVPAPAPVQVRPTPTPATIFTPSEAIAIIQQYLGTKTYTQYSTPRTDPSGRLGPQLREQRPCIVFKEADWQAEYQEHGFYWIVTREIDWDAHWDAIFERLGTTQFRASFKNGVQVDMWTLNERTRIVEWVGPEGQEPGRKEC